MQVNEALRDNDEETLRKFTTATAYTVSLQTYNAHDMLCAVHETLRAFVDSDVAVG